MTRRQKPIPEPITQLQQQLNEWRGTNRPRTRLPEPFWNAAVELARQYGIYRTAHPLRLDYADLKQRLLGRQSRRPKRAGKVSKAAFVELHTSNTPQPDEWSIEFESSRGHKMRVQWKSTVPLDWVLLLRAWREVQG